jgi:hypothetical protein
MTDISNLTQHNIPSFAPPQPRRFQRLAFFAAGALLGGGAPREVMDRFVQDVGGYQEKDGLFPGAGLAAKEYTHPDASRHTVRAPRDETDVLANRTPTTQVYKTHRDASDGEGTYLPGAVRGTVDRRRTTGKLAKTLRGRTALYLMRVATKGGFNDPKSFAKRRRS